MSKEKTEGVISLNIKMFIHIYLKKRSRHIAVDSQLYNLVKIEFWILQLSETITILVTKLLFVYCCPQLLQNYLNIKHCLHFSIIRIKVKV